MHLKRQKAPKNWPITRKGTKYVVRPSFDIQKAIPILVILRDVLEIAQNRKEVKKAIHMKNILLNNKIIIDEKIPCFLFDVIKIVPTKKYYRINLSENGKFKVEEINENESNHKISKILGKKIIKRKKIQINLSDGRNFLSDIKCKINDSILIDSEKKKIEKCLPLKEKSEAIVYLGKYAGKKGIIEKIDSKNKIVELRINKEKNNILIKQLMVIK